MLLINFCFYRKLFFTNVVSSSLPRNLFLVWSSYSAPFTLHKKMKFSIKDFFSKCDQIRSFCSFLRIWPHLPKKSLMGNFTFAQCQRELLHWFYATFGVIYYFAFSSPLWPDQVEGKTVIMLQVFGKKALQHWYFVFLIFFSSVGLGKWFLF